MMVTALVGLMVLGQNANPFDINIPDEPKSYLAAYYKKPSGKNGYEDYLKAIDAIGKPAVKHLMSKVLADQTSFKKPTPDSRKLVKSCQSAIELVRRGNSKPIVYPSTTDVDFSFIVNAKFKALAKIMSLATTVNSSDGNTQTATAIALDSLRFARAISERSNLDCLVGMTIEAIAKASISQMLSKLKERDAKSIEMWARKELGRQPSLSASMQIESKQEIQDTKQFVLNAYKAVKTGKPIRQYHKYGKVGDIGDAEVWNMIESLAKGWKQYSAAKIQEVISNRSSYVVACTKANVEALLKPEAEWQEPIVPEEQGGDFILTILWPVSESLSVQAMQAEARRRTQTRILLLHSLIIQFREREKSLPQSLADLDDAQALHDPLTSSEFRYEPYKDGTWAVYSVGTTQSGRIDLVYKRAPIDSQPSRPPAGTPN